LEIEKTNILNLLTYLCDKCQNFTNISLHKQIEYYDITFSSYFARALIRKAILEKQQIGNTTKFLYKWIYKGFPSEQLVDDLIKETKNIKDLQLAANVLKVPMESLEVKTEEPKPITEKIKRRYVKRDHSIELSEKKKTNYEIAIEALEEERIKLSGNLEDINNAIDMIKYLQDNYHH